MEPSPEEDADFQQALVELTGFLQAQDEFLRDDADSGSKLGDARMHAARVHDSVLEEWAESESERPTQPQRALGISSGATRSKKYLKERLLARMANLMQEGGPPQGAAKILLIRAKRAYELLTDETRLQIYKDDLKARIENDSLANLRFGNGFYEGDVPPESMENGMRPVRHGKGVLMVSSGEVYEGHFEMDQRSGIGVCFWQSGDLYLGQWAEDRCHGRGMYFYHGGNSHIGEFANGLPHGEGLQYWKDGSAYGGSFVAGIRTGSGIMELPRSQAGKVMGLYMGEWKDNRMHGKGHWELHDKNHDPRVYNGEFMDDQFHGRGKLVEPSGEVYDGIFVHGVRHGQGSSDLPGNEHFQGDFRRNLRHGSGTAYREAGETNGFFHFSGSWKNNMPHGDGKLKMEANGQTWEMEGEFEEGRLDGKGTVAYPSGGRYEGQFHRGEMHGHGSFTFKDGSSWNGKFEDSKALIMVNPAEVQ